MKPPAFRYYAPRTLGEALQVKDAFGPEAVVLAGGQSLMPMLNMRLARPEAVIDIGRIDRLDEIRASDDGLAFGPMTRQRAVERSGLVRERCPLLTAAVSNVAHAIIRNRGTIVGSIAHADPAAELPAALVALNGRVTAQSVRGTRVIAADDFFTFHLTTALEPDELVTEVCFPAQPATSRWHVEEIARRHGDFALAGVAAYAHEEEGMRMVFFGVGPTPVRVAAAAEAVAAVDPTDDVHGSAAYRRQLVSVLAQRASEAMGADV